MLAKARYLLCTNADIIQCKRLKYRQSGTLVGNKIVEHWDLIVFLLCCCWVQVNFTHTFHGYFAVEQKIIRLTPVLVEQPYRMWVKITKNPLGIIIQTKLRKTQTVYIFTGWPIQGRTYIGAMTWKHFPDYWHFVRVIHLSQVDSHRIETVMRSLGVLFIGSLNMLLRKQSSCRRFEKQ